jgi:hypothetical protein
MSQQNNNDPASGAMAGRGISGTTVAMLKTLDHESLSSCLYAACDLALRVARGTYPLPPENMTADQLVRQLIMDMPPRPAAAANSAKKQ